MADADCELCAMMGYTTCDVCGDTVFVPTPPGAPDLCYLCRTNRAGAAPTTPEAATP